MIELIKLGLFIIIIIASYRLFVWYQHGLPSDKDVNDVDNEYEQKQKKK